MEAPDHNPKNWTHYSREQQAAALAALDGFGGNFTATAAATGIPRTTLQEWARAAVSLPSDELRQQSRSHLAERFEDLAGRMLDTAVEKAGDLDGKAATIAAAVAVDKMLLLRGEATSITETRDDARVKLLAERYGQLRRIQVQPIEPAPPSLPPSGGGVEQPASDAGGGESEGQAE